MVAVHADADRHRRAGFIHEEEGRGKRGEGVRGEERGVKERREGNACMEAALVCVDADRHLLSGFIREGGRRCVYESNAAPGRSQHGC